MSKARWRKLGSYQVDGSVTSWRCEVAVRSEGNSLWSVRWRGEEAEEQLIGPASIESLTEDLVEEFNADRDDMLRLYAISGIKDFEDFVENQAEQ